jgi:hypothetical protein
MAWSFDAGVAADQPDSVRPDPFAERRLTSASFDIFQVPLLVEGLEHALAHNLDFARRCQKRGPESPITHPRKFRLNG